MKLRNVGTYERDEEAGGGGSDGGAIAISIPSLAGFGCCNVTAID